MKNQDDLASKVFLGSLFAIVVGVLIYTFASMTSLQEDSTYPRNQMEFTTGPAGPTGPQGPSGLFYTK